MWELDHKAGWMPKNWFFWTVVLKKTPGVPWTARRWNQLNLGSQPWIFIRRTDAKIEAPILWPPHSKSQLIKKRPWCWERLKAGGEGGDRGWDGWMASLTQWTWVWANSGRWWMTGKPGVLQSMGLQRVGCDWETELNSKNKAPSIANSTILPFHSGLSLNFP